MYEFGGWAACTLFFKLLYWATSVFGCGALGGRLWCDILVMGGLVRGLPCALLVHWGRVGASIFGISFLLMWLVGAGLWLCGVGLLFVNPLPYVTWWHLCDVLWALMLTVVGVCMAGQGCTFLP